MNETQTIPFNSATYYRLIALWVLNEALLGGIIHGLKIPVSGLIVGSCATICICLIASYAPFRGAIIKATVIVAIFKMMLSPQSPPPAYIAVFFQGLMGEILFFNRRLFKVSCVVLAILALVESGLQRILVLTIVYGNDLWQVINSSINGLTKQKTAFNYSFYIASGYVLIHLMTGLAVGAFAGSLPAKISRWSKDSNNRFVITDSESEIVKRPGRKRRLKRGLFIVWIILLLLYAQDKFKIGTPLLPPAVSLRLLVRSAIIVLSWYFVIAPLAQSVLHLWLKKKRTRLQRDIEAIINLLPSTKQLILGSWERCKDLRGLNKLLTCVKVILVNALDPIIAGKYFILTGAIETGKTTSLVKWSENRTNVFGIATPVVNGKRNFMNLHARHLFDMEAREDEKEMLLVGRYVFSKNNFDKAIQIIRDAKHQNGWLIIDEIGPMELRGDGFREVVKEVIASGNGTQKIVLVVREGLVDKVKESFQLKDAIVINKVSDLV